MNHETKNERIDATTKASKPGVETSGSYEAPRIEKREKLAEVTAAVAGSLGAA